MSRPSHRHLGRLDIYLFPRMQVGSAGRVLSFWPYGTGPSGTRPSLELGKSIYSVTWPLSVTNTYGRPRCAWPVLSECPSLARPSVEWLVQVLVVFGIIGGHGASNMGQYLCFDDNRDDKVELKQGGGGYITLLANQRSLKIGIVSYIFTYILYDLRKVSSLIKI